MRAGFGQFQDPTPEYLLYAQQFGVTDILLNHANIPAIDGKWQLHDLVNLRRRVETYGMKLSALENVPREFYDQVKSRNYEDLILHWKEFPGESHLSVVQTAINYGLRALHSKK